MKYDPKSSHAEEFISHEEIEETLAYGQANRENRALIDEILAKARERKGLSHREAMVLLDCALEDKNQEIFALAEQIKKDFYGNRIVLFAPLYLSNYCINGCVYCPYHAKNKHIPRKKTDTGRNPAGGYRPSGYGAQASGFGDRRRSGAQSHRVSLGIH